MTMKKRAKEKREPINLKVEYCRQCGLQLSQEDLRKGYRICEFCRQDYGKDYHQKFVKRRKNNDDEDEYSNYAQYDQ